MRTIHLERQLYRAIESCEDCKHVYVCCFVDKHALDLIRSHPKTTYYINMNSYNLQGFAGDNKADLPMWDTIRELNGMPNVRLVNPAVFPIGGDEPFVTALHTGPHLYRIIEERFPWLQRDTASIEFARKKWFAFGKESTYEAYWKQKNATLEGFQTQFADDLAKDSELNASYGEMVTLQNKLDELKQRSGGEWRSVHKEWMQFCKQHPHPSSRVDKRDAQKMYGVIKQGFAKLDNDLLGLAYVERHGNKIPHKRLSFEDYKKGEAHTDPAIFQRDLFRIVYNDPSVAIDGLMVDMELDDIATVAYAVARKMPLKSIIVQRGSDAQYDGFREALAKLEVSANIVSEYTASISSLLKAGFVVQVQKLPNYDKVVNAVETLGKMFVNRIGRVTTRV